MSDAKPDSNPKKVGGNGISPLVLIVAIAGSVGATYLAMSVMAGAESNTPDADTTVHFKTRASEAVRAVNGGGLSSLYSSTMTDKTLNELLPAAKLLTAELARSPITNRGIETLSKSKSLHEINLTQTSVDDDSIDFLATLPALEAIVLNSTEVTDEGAVKLSGIPSLREVRLRRTTVGDKTATALAGLSGLRTVGMSYTRITDDGVKELCKLTELEELRLAGTTITDAALEQIATLPNLKRLDIADTHVTDKGIAFLANSTTLNDLWVSRTDVTAAGLDPIRALPSLRLLGVSGISGEEELIAGLPQNGGSLRTIFVSNGMADDAIMTALEDRDPPLFIRSVYQPDSVRSED